MCVLNTPVEDYTSEFGLYVKREDLCCPPGPHFSKCRGVYSHIAKRPESVIGVLDTSHSQGGWAVAQACNLLNKNCILYYPVRKSDRGKSVNEDPYNGLGALGDILKPQQLAAQKLGASLVPLQAGRSAVLYHQAKKEVQQEAMGVEAAYMMPNALKLPESVHETAAEFGRTEIPSDVNVILVSASSATIAAGVIEGAARRGWQELIIVHMGYSRSERAVRSYIDKMGKYPILFRDNVYVEIVDEGYDYADSAKPGPNPPFPCNEFYDLKAFRWWLAEGHRKYGKALLWNIG